MAQAQGPTQPNHARPAVREAQQKTAAQLRKDKGVLYVGIDLGTSRSSIAASNGVRATVESCVGYPKDPVAFKLIKKDVLFGSEARAHRLSCNFYRPLEHGVIRGSEADNRDTKEDPKIYAKAARDLVKHVVSLAKPRPDELVYAVIGAPAQASIHNKQAIIDAAREVVDAVMIASEPFSVAYGLDQLTGALVIDIGAGTTDLCRMHGVMPDPDDQLTNTFAGDYVDRKLFENLKKSCEGASLTVQMAKDIKERFGFIGRVNSPISVKFPVEGRPTSFEVSGQIKDACLSIVEPMKEGIRRLIASYDPEFQQQLRGNVLLAGGGSQIVGLDDALEDALEELGGGKVTIVEEPMFAGCNGALKLAHDMPDEYWKALS
ncbi:MAG: MamK family actin-like protein [Planctomycetes bacterium]|nr:MamK family actin-like protein [Planctomycetota bacterium]